LRQSESAKLIALGVDASAHSLAGTKPRAAIWCSVKSKVYSASWRTALFCSAKTSLRRPPATLAQTGAPKTGDTLKARYDIVQQILLKSQ